MKLSRRTLLAGAATIGLVSSASMALAQSAADIAVEAAKQFAGTELTVFYEAGLQPLDPINFSGPLWEELTGIKINIVEAPLDQMFTKIIQETKAATGAYDILNVIPNQMPDLALAGALEPLDDYIERYGYADEIAGIGDVYRNNQMTVEGVTYGLADDGDVLLMYYRKDIFEDPEMQSGFKAEFGYDLAPPADWQQFNDIAGYITKTMGPDVYGAGMHFQPGNFQYLFQERFRVEGGTFFDADTMRATVNSEVGLKVFNDILADIEHMPPGVEQWGFIEMLNAFMDGQTAMTISWPPVGRWTAGYGSDTEALSWLPETTVGGDVGYALPPGGTPELAIGFSLSVSSASENKEAAYLFAQWMNSEEISLQRVQLPFAMRDPFRASHYADPEYRSRWDGADEYLDALQAGSVSGLLDLSLIQTDRYEEALRQAIGRLWAKEDPQTILDDLASQWDDLTDRIGVDDQRRVYADWASKPNAYPN